MLNKEIRIHLAMKHVNILDFLNAVVVERNGKTKYIPGIYMLLELASGGDLFDKIGVCNIFFSDIVVCRCISATSSGCWH